MLFTHSEPCTLRSCSSSSCTKARAGTPESKTHWVCINYGLLEESVQLIEQFAQALVSEGQMYPARDSKADHCVVFPVRLQSEHIFTFEIDVVGELIDNLDSRYTKLNVRPNADLFSEIPFEVLLEVEW